MMSQIVMSIFRSPDPSGLGEASSFFETLVPRVWMYLSSKLSRTNRRMSEVFPTAASPIRQTFTFIRLTSMNSRPAPWHTRRDPLKRYGGVISADTRSGGMRPIVAQGRRLANRLVSLAKYGTEGASMCDEYYDARMKAFGRALAEESERELDETE